MLELESNGVTAKVGKFGETISQAEHEEHRGVVAERDAGLFLLDPVQCHPANRSALHDDRRLNAPAEPGVANVLPALPQRAADARGAFWGQSFIGLSTQPPSGFLSPIMHAISAWRRPSSHGRFSDVHRGGPLARRQDRRRVSGSIATVVARSPICQRRFVRILAMYWRGWTPYSRSRCRCRNRSGDYRIVYVTARSGEIVVVLAFKKAAFKTPDRMIKLARSRARETE